MQVFSAKQSNFAIIFLGYIHITDTTRISKQIQNKI